MSSGKKVTTTLSPLDNTKASSPTSSSAATSAPVNDTKASSPTSSSAATSAPVNDTKASSPTSSSAATSAPLDLSDYVESVDPATGRTFWFDKKNRR